MTISDKNKPIGENDVDRAVSGEYRRLATERTPNDLDFAVLRIARKEVKKKALSSWQIGWFRPTAFVFTLALSFALILEMNDGGILPTGFAIDEKAIPPETPANIFLDAAEEFSGQVRDAEEAVRSTTQNSGVNKPMLIQTGANEEQRTLHAEGEECNEEQRSTVTSWWQCIEALEKGGATTSAERELTEFIGAFPDFARPE